ncbi:MAG: hypothetical protein IK990_11670 [Ruminiclostridium sp.]|nr:hypothetical protein [Ruminiclostridium sp.]
MVLCIAICAVAGCSGSSNNVESTTTTAAETTTTTTTAATEAETTAATTETNEEAPAVEGTVIYDANDIMITATEFTTCKVKLTEDGDSGILLTYGTGEEFHLVPAAE